VLGGLLAFAIIALLVPVLGALVLAILVGGASYGWSSRPLAVIDCHHRVLNMGRHQIPFAQLGLVHTIERRDEESRENLIFELLMGPRLATRYEVYFRVGGEPLLLAEFTSKEAAGNLMNELPSVMREPS
jgi:hypothetical protein